MKKQVRLFSLLFLGILFICFKTANKKVTIYAIGDSITASYDSAYLIKAGGLDYPLRGWMQMMPQFFNNQVVIKNAAKSGRSSKSFRDEGLWKNVIEQVEPGDYVFILFGGNEQKLDSARHTEPQTSYKQNLRDYVNETKAKGAFPILCTQIVRRKFDTNGKLVDTFGDYVTAVRDVAKETNVPLIDLFKKTWDMVQKYGPEGSKILYLNIKPGVYSTLPNGKSDDHLCVLGATKVAELAAQGLKELNHPLAAYLK